MLAGSRERFGSQARAEVGNRLQVLKGSTLSIPFLSFLALRDLAPKGAGAGVRITHGLDGDRLVPILEVTHEKNGAMALHGGRAFIPHQNDLLRVNEGDKEVLNDAFMSAMRWLHPSGHAFERWDGAWGDGCTFPWAGGLDVLLRDNMSLPPGPPHVLVLDHILAPGSWKGHPVATGNSLGHGIALYMACRNEGAEPGQDVALLDDRDHVDAAGQPTFAMKAMAAPSL